MLTFDVVLCHDNANEHKVARTGAVVENFNWKFFARRPNSSNPTPRDYNLLNHLKN
jgi:hypothetical protein